MIATAAHRPVSAESAIRADRKLDDAPSAGQSDLGRPQRPFRDAISPPVHREDTRIVGKARLAELFQRPQRLANDREVWSPIAANRLAQNLFQDVFAAANIGTEFLGGLPEDFQMAIALAGGFVASA